MSAEARTRYRSNANVQITGEASSEYFYANRSPPAPGRSAIYLLLDHLGRQSASRKAMITRLRNRVMQGLGQPKLATARPGARQVA